jgi:phytanoyl-CoA hydroxylase
MLEQVTAEQVAAYQENGFIVLEDFLSPAELAHWREVTEESVAQRLEASKKEGGDWVANNTNQGDPDNYYAQVFTQCVKLAETHPGMHELIYDERLGRIAGTLAGVDGIRIWHDQALFKPPFGNPTAWHVDNPYWSFHSANSLSIWIALDDATYQNGCLYYLPGTHKNLRYENANIGQNMADLFKFYPEYRKISPVGCPCPAGSAVFHNGLTAHGAGANMTEKPRRAMTCAYMPDGEVFNGNDHWLVIPEEYKKRLKVGDLINDDKYVPLIWKKG